MTTSRGVRPLVLLVAVALASPAAEAFQGGPPPPPPLPQLPPVPEPADNPVTEAKRVLGKILFWDEQLSSDNSIACGTCHLPEAGGGDPRLGAHPGADGQFGGDDDVVGSPGVVRSDPLNAFVDHDVFGLDVQITGRNAPTAFNMTQYADELFWDGRAGDAFLDPETGATVVATGGALESQAVGPILSDAEMGHEARDWPEVLAKLERVTPLRLATDVPADMVAALAVSPDYPALFQAAFGTADITAERIGRALATYERTVVPDQTPYDAFAAGDNGALTADQQAGLQALQTSLCNACHAAPFFTDFRFHNLGLRPGSEDIGRQEVTGDPADLGRFRTPSLRNAGLKSALMHTGWVTSVDDAVRFYNAPAFPAVSPAGHTQFTADQTGVPTPGGTVPLQNISIGPVERAQIVDFIENGLTDPRAAAGTFPFDRPTLLSERAANPEPFGAPSLGDDGPHMLASTPLARDNPDFRIGLGGVTAGSLAYLVFTGAAAAPGLEIAPEVPLHVDPATLAVLRAFLVPGVGPDACFTYQIPVQDDPAITGLVFHAQWIVLDPAAPLGISSSGGARWTGL